MLTSSVPFAHANIDSGTPLASHANSSKTPSNIVSSSKVPNQYSPTAGPVPVLIAAGFNQPTGLALDSNGSIYVAEDIGASIKRIQHYPNGSFSPTVDMVLNTPNTNVGLASDQENNLYFTSYWGGYVDELPVGCNSLSCLRTLNSTADGPRGVAVDSHGYVWFTTRRGGGSDNGTVRIYYPGNDSTRVLLNGQNYVNLISIGPDDCAYWGVMNSGVGSDHVPEVRRYCLGMATYQTLYTFTTQCINGVFGACPEIPWGVRADSSGDVFWSTWNTGKIMMLANSSTTPTVILDYRNVNPTVHPEIGDIILDGAGHLYYLILDVYPAGTISLSPSDGPAGTSVTVTSANWPLDFLGTEDTNCSINPIPSIPTIFAASPEPTCSISNGNVTASFTVASGAAPGNYTIDVIGFIPGDPWSGVDGYASFIVDASSPSPPAHNAPSRIVISQNHSARSNKLAAISPDTLGPMRACCAANSVNGITLTNIQKRTVFSVVRGTDSGVYYGPDLVGSWNGWTRLPGATLGSPGAVQCGGQLYLAVQGTNNGVYFGSLNTGTKLFSGWSKLPGATLSGPGLAADATCNLYMAVRGTNNGVYLNTYTGSAWQGWSRLPGATIDGPGVAVTASTIYLAVRGMNNGIYFGRITRTGMTFQGWVNVGGATSGRPGLAAVSDVEVYVTVQGTNNGIYLNKWNGAAWAGWAAPAGGATPSGPAVIVSGGTLYLMVRGLDNSIYWSSGTWGGSWSPWTKLTGATPSSPALA